MAESAIREIIHRTSPLGIQISFTTVPGGHHPLHWHQETEILYPLNGTTTLIIGRKSHSLDRQQITVIEAGQVHSIHCRDKTSMFLSIHISREPLAPYLAELSLCQIRCLPGELEPDQLEEYSRLCALLDNLVRLYISDAPGFLLEAEGTVLQLFARLLRSFSQGPLPSFPAANRLAVQRIQALITYTEQHYADPIPLSQAAELTGLGREAFCRFFKKNMGVSFTQYLTEVRLSHIYQDLQATSLPISQVMEKNGFSSQKRFNRSFKELYGCTPSAVRRPRLNSAASHSSE